MHKSGIRYGNKTRVTETVLKTGFNVWSGLKNIQLKPKEKKTC